jgi:hypothetical protein
MTDKMEQIESKIKGTVDDTKRMVDIRYQVSQRPWIALGTSVLIGYALGSLGDSQSASPSYSGSAVQYFPASTEDRNRSSATSGERDRYTNTSYQQEPRHSSEPGIVDQLKDQFGGELETLKAAAVASLISLVRDAVRQNLPALHQEVERLRAEHNMPAASTSSRYYDTADTIARERAVGEDTSHQNDTSQRASYGYSSPMASGAANR